MSRSLYCALVLVGAPAVLNSGCSKHDPCHLHVDKEWCARVMAGLPGSGGAGGAGGSAAGGPSVTSGPGAGGSGGGCNSPADCPSGPCKEATCSGGFCGEVNLPDGVLAEDDIKGDCSFPYCEQGVLKYDLSVDPPQSTDPCTNYTCNGKNSWKPEYADQYKMVGSCGGDFRCDGAGKCASKEGQSCGGLDDPCAGECIDGTCRSGLDGPCKDENHCKQELNGNEVVIVCSNINNCYMGVCKATSDQPCSGDAECASNKCKNGNCFVCKNDADCGPLQVCHKDKGACLPKCDNATDPDCEGDCVQAAVEMGSIIYGCLPPCAW